MAAAREAVGPTGDLDAVEFARALTVLYRHLVDSGWRPPPVPRALLAVVDATEDAELATLTACVEGGATPGPTQ